MNWLGIEPDLIQRILCRLPLHGKWNGKMEETVPGISV
jgi:hypothetical protein